MSSDFSWRIDLARDVAAHYARRPGVAFIVLGGSAARGPTDAWSDLDILVYWDTPDIAWVETAPLEAQGAQRFTWRVTFADEVWLEQYFIGAQKIDVAHATVAWWEKLVAEVAERGDSDDWKQGTIGGFLESQCLHGAARFRPFHERIARHPDALAKHMVQANLFFYPPWVIEKQGLARGDLYAFQDILAEQVRHLLAVWAGLSRRYFAKDKIKRLRDTADRMTVKPENAGARLEALYAMPREDVPAALSALVRDTLDLVDAQRPDVDTARARRVFSMTLEGCTERPAFEGPP